MIPTTVAAIAGINHIIQELWGKKGRAINIDKTNEEGKNKIKLWIIVHGYGELLFLICKFSSVYTGNLKEKCPETINTCMCFFFSFYIFTSTNVKTQTSNFPIFLLTLYFQKHFLSSQYSNYSDQCWFTAINSKQEMWHTAVIKLNSPWLFWISFMHLL